MESRRSVKCWRATKVTRVVHTNYSPLPTCLAVQEDGCQADHYHVLKRSKESLNPLKYVPI